MMTIEVYCGDPQAPRNAAEQRVLARIIGILRARGEAAIVLTNVRCGERECDLLVSTPTTTLVIEVKCYSQPVMGGLHDAYWTTRYTGEQWKNPCLQALHTMHALKDALRGFAGRDPGYPRRVVVFDGGIPPGSDVPQSTDRMAIASDSELEALLACPLIERNETRRWSLELLRAWAFKRRMVLDVTSAGASPVTYAPRPVPIAPAQVIRETPAPSIVRAGPARRAQRSRRIWPIVACLLVAIAIGQWWRARPRPAPGESVALGQSKKAAQWRHHNRHSVSAARVPVTPIPSVPPAVQGVAATEAPPPSTGPLPPCPAGIDRLGCTPDSATLQQLRRD